MPNRPANVNIMVSESHRLVKYGMDVNQSVKSAICKNRIRARDLTRTENRFDPLNGRQT